MFGHQNRSADDLPFYPVPADSPTAIAVATEYEHEQEQEYEQEQEHAHRWSEHSRSITLGDRGARMVHPASPHPRIRKNLDRFDGRL